MDGLLSQEETGKGFAQHLLLLGITHLVVGANPPAHQALPLLGSRSQTVWQNFLRDHAETVESGNDVTVLKVVSSGTLP